jgi:hypothetical protein
MEHVARIDDWDERAFERELDRELLEVDAAVALVRSGMARVVTIANLRHADEVLERLRARETDDSVELAPRAVPGQAGGELEVRLLGA